MKHRQPSYYREQSERAETRSLMPIRTFAQCAEIMGCSVSRAQELERQAFEKIRKALTESGYIDASGRIARENGQ